MLTLKSPAKINLFLRIIHRRQDGYHELASLFQAIDLCDTIHIENSKHDKLTCTSDSLPMDDSNLIAKARDLFRAKTGIYHSFSIYLEKKIPIQAGLGGGSSNAATTLWAINKLSGSPVNDIKLTNWAAEIGSDISFFLSSGTAYCTGRGEILREMPRLNPQSLWIVKPSLNLCTKEVFRKLNPSELMMRDPEISLQSFYQSEKECYNDLEHPVFKMNSELAEIKQRLIDSGFKVVSMSGSGSSFFCIGNGNFSKLKNCQIFQSSYINREMNAWY